MVRVFFPDMYMRLMGGKYTTTLLHSTLLYFTLLHTTPLHVDVSYCVLIGVVSGDQDFI